MNRKRVILIGLMLLWMGLIFWFSAQDRTDSVALSGKLLRKLLALLPGWDDLSAAAQLSRINMLHLLFRKLAHFTEYAVLGVFASLTLRLGFPTDIRTQQRVRYWLIPACFVLLYAVSDELHQCFSPGRTPGMKDVCIDFAGACIGIILTGMILSRFKKRRTS